MCDKNISELDFENKEGKSIVSIENFAYRVIMEINGAKYLYNALLIGAIDVVSQKYQIVCKVIKSYLIL